MCSFFGFTEETCPLTNASIEQHLADIRVGPQSRLPSLQEGSSSRVGRPPEQARRQVVILFQGQALRAHRRPVAARTTGRYWRDS